MNPNPLANHLKGVPAEQLLVYAIHQRAIVLHHSLTNILLQPEVLRYAPGTCEGLQQIFAEAEPSV